MNQSDPRTVGERLRAAREALNFSLEDAAKATSIKFNHLQELEDDHPEVFTSIVQARGFLRLYAAFLNLDVNELVTLWDAPDKAEEPEKMVEQKISPKPLNPDETTPTAEPVTEEKVNAEAQTESQQKLEKKSAPNLLLPLTGKIKELFSRITVPEKIKSAFLRLSVPVKLKGIASKVKFPARKLKPEVSEAAAPLETSQEIFREIGAALRDRRLAMDLNLSDIEHFTNLKRMVLVAIEDGRFNDLPSTVQGRGMLNNYAKFLAMDDSAVMDRYAQALQLQREERMPSRKAPEPAVIVKFNLPKGLRRVLNPDLVIGGALILALFGFILWGASQMLASSGEKPTEAPSISQMLQMTPSVSPMPDLTRTAEATQLSEQETAVPGVIIAQSTPTPVATANAAPLQVYIIAHDRAFMRITVDGMSAFDGRVLPNNVYTYSGNDLITLLTGNGEALEVYFNQEYLGKLGDVGEVVELRFSLQGLQTPTPRPQPTPITAMTSGEADATPEGN